MNSNWVIKGTMVATKLLYPLLVRWLLLTEDCLKTGFIQLPFVFFVNPEGYVQAGFWRLYKLSCNLVCIEWIMLDLTNTWLMRWSWTWPASCRLHGRISILKPICSSWHHCLGHSRKQSRLEAMTRLKEVKATRFPPAPLFNLHITQ